MRVLWVTEESPDRSLGGGNIRQAHLFEALASAYPTDLLVVGEVRDPRIREVAASVIELPKLGVLQTQHPVGRRLLELAIMLGSPYPSLAYPLWRARRALARAIRRLPAPHDLVCIEHEALAPLPAVAHAKSVITFHHLFSGMTRQELELAPGRRQRWYRMADLRKAQRLERLALRRYDRVVVCSPEDAAALNGGTAAEAGRIAVIPNGVDLAKFRPAPLPAAARVLFPGTLSYAPNVDGARWFCAEVWPHVRGAFPSATLELVGRAPPPEVMALGELDGVSVHADVPSMNPHYEAARVVVVPLRTGTGTRLKALEAMASGRPVVGTTIGLEGIGIAAGEQALVADDPAALADAVIALLRDDQLAGRLARSGRSHVEQRFGWDRIGKDYVATVAELLGRPRE